MKERWCPQAWLPSCQSVPSHLAAFKDCPAETRERTEHSPGDFYE
ncbi:uncharacterized, partial [Tachysurus ichikawai]